MRKVVLRMNEEKKYNVIKKLVDNNGNKKRAAIELQYSLRTINRLIQKYLNEGKSGFIHGNRNRKPSTAFSKETKSMIINTNDPFFKMTPLNKPIIQEAKKLEIVSKKILKLFLNMPQSVETETRKILRTLFGQCI